MIDISEGIDSLNQFLPSFLSRIRENN